MGLIKRIQECCLRGSRIGILRSGILNPGHPLHHRGYSIRFRTRAVIFDMGGVILPSPHPITKEYETERNIPLGTIAKTIETNGKDGAWHKLEVGLLNSYEFSSFFTKECSITAGTTIDVNDFLQYLESKMCKPIPEVLNAVKAIRAENIKTALLTNNWRNFDNTTLLPFNRSTFDVVVESAVVGANKPDPVIYQKCLIELGVKPEDCIFLDDFGSNLRTARSLGIRTIKVENITDALKELEETLMFPLSGYVKGTRAIRKGMEIPQDRLVEYIEDSLRVVPSNNLLNIRQFNHGQSNPTYYVEYGDIRAVLRKKPPGKLMPSAHAVDREYRVMSAMSKAGIPIPRLLSFCDDPTVIGTEFYLMEFVNGAIYKNPRLPGLEIEKRQLIYGNLLQVLSQIHSVNIEEANLSDYGKKGNYIARQVSTWSRQYRASETRTISAIERLMEWLPEHLPADEKTTVVHGDFRLDNLIFDPISHEVLAVIDWELSTLGDPLSDLAYQCLAHFLPKDFPILPGMSGVNLKSAGIFTVEEIVNRYCKLRNIPAIDNFDFYMAFAFFRVSAILQGVYKRSTQGQASSASASAAGKLAGSLAEIGWTFASKEGFRKFNKINPSLLSSKSDHTISSKKNYHTCGIGAVRSYHHGNGKGLLPVTSEALSPRVQTLLKSVKQFIRDDIIPMEEEIRNKDESSDPEKKWTVHPCIENLKEKAKSQALWNLFIPIETDPEEEYGAGLTNVEYAYLCEEMGRCIYAPEIFNCSAPDTGNMEVLIKYGSEEQKKKWLEPLLSGSIRSCFSMTEPKVASSDATNIETSISSNGDGWIINGHKWWTSGAMDKRTKFAIVMGKTDSTALRHKQQSMVIVPLDSPGVSIVRPLTVYGLYDAPAGHAELLYENVHVPKKNMILEPGSGFEIAQGRLGPGRIHHCMRLIGHAERSLDLMKERVKSRVAFGKALVEQGTIQQEIAKSRIDIEQARLLVLKTAHMMDTVGNKVAAPEIAMIKVLVPQMAGKVIDRAIQAHGAAGLSSDLPLAIFSMWARALRLADGPDEVHVRSIARMELKS